MKYTRCVQKLKRKIWCVHLCLGLRALVLSTLHRRELMNVHFFFSFFYFFFFFHSSITRTLWAPRCARSARVLMEKMIKIKCSNVFKAAYDSCSSLNDDDAMRPEGGCWLPAISATKKNRFIHFLWVERGVGMISANKCNMHIYTQPTECTVFIQFSNNFVCLMYSLHAMAWR